MTEAPQRSQVEFNQKLAYGKDFEERFSDYLVQRDWGVIPYYLLNKSGAPLMLGKTKYILPDMLAYKNGKGVWFECKRKTRMSNGLTGYKVHNHDSYKSIQEKTGHDVFVIWEDNKEWYGNYIDNLESCPKTQRFKCQGDMNIMFQYPDAFLKIYEK